MNNRNLAYDRSIDYDAWRPALAAFYRADCWFMTADLLDRGEPLTVENKRHIHALKAAFDAIEMREAA